MIIIQARTNSSRLPNKIMQEIGGTPIVKHVYNTCSLTGNLVVVAVPENDPVIEYLKKERIPYFEGSEEDVLARYYHCARAYSAKYVVRITADCPLLDLPYILYVLRFVGQMHYVQVTGIDGQDVELMSMEALELAHKDSQKREHVTDFIRGHKDLRPQAIHTIPYTAEKMSVDTEEDLKRVREIYANRHPSGK